MNAEPFLSLILPTYDEAETILPVVDSAHAALGARAHEIIVVDDDSPDGTSQRVQHHARHHPWLRLLTRRGARGLSGAVLEGIKNSQGDYIGIMDADGSHDERILPLLIQALEEGADLAIGSRRIPGGGADHWPWYRRLTSDLATRLARGFLHVSLSDPMSGYFVFKRTLYDHCGGGLRSEGYKILLELYCLGRPQRVREIPFVFKDRKQGYSKLNSRVMGHYLESLWQLRRAR